MSNMTELVAQIKAVPGVAGLYCSMNNDLIVIITDDSQETRNAVRSLAVGHFNSIKFDLNEDVELYDEDPDLKLPELPF